MLDPSIAPALHHLLSDWSEVLVAVLFGSQARGTATERSDIDLAVLAPGLDLLALSAALSRALRREVDCISLEDPPIPLQEELIARGLIVHEAEPGAGALWRSRTLASLETDRPWFQRMRDSWLRRVAERGL